MLNKYFIVADVHGFYDELISVLTTAGFDKENPNHIFVSLGDLFDRGYDSLSCLKFVMSLEPGRRILIRGNHESLLEDIRIKRVYSDTDIKNGTLFTCIQFTDSIKASNISYNLTHDELYLSYIYSLENYHELEHSVFVHGWIPDTNNWRKASTSEWESARWLNGMDEWHQGKIVPNKTVYCGHWDAAWGHCHLHHEGEEYFYTSKKELCTCNNSLPFVDNGIVALDACTVITHRVNCFIVNDEELI